MKTQSTREEQKPRVMPKNVANLSLPENIWHPTCDVIIQNWTKSKNYHSIMNEF